MKSILVLLACLLTSVYSFSQTTTYEVTPEIIVYLDEDLCREFDEFITDYKKAELDLNKLTAIKGIYYSTELQHRNIFGRTDVVKGHVYITTDIPNYLPSLVEIILYHELGHLLMHEAMHKYFGSYITRQGGDINIEFAIVHWAFLKKDYMNYLKLNSK